METVLKAIADWIKGILTAGIMSNLSGLFDDVNTQVGNIAQQVGTKPSSFEPRVFAMIEALSRNVVLPIAGIILTFIACYELIEMITQHNNMAQFEPALIMRWIFKTAVSVWFISNTFDIVMAVFDITQKVVSDSSGIIAGNTRVNDIGLSMLEASLMQMDVGPLFGLFLQSFFIGITMRILSIIIFVIVYGRMIEIYCMVSLAPIPMATFGNHEQSHMGQNYKDNADTIVGNMDSQIFLGGSEPTTLKELSEALGKETIDSYNNSDTRGNSPSYGTNYQKLGHELLSRDEIAVLDGGKCILQLRGVRPFLSDKYDLTQHPNYKYTSDYDPKNALDIEKFLKRKEKIHPDDTFIMVDADSLPPA